jgi:hypothetical protein
LFLQTITCAPSFRQFGFVEPIKRVLVLCAHIRIDLGPQNAPMALLIAAVFALFVIAELNDQRLVQN